MKYEKTQKGNPHQLVVQQHVFPAASIERFCSPRGGVEALLMQESKVITVNAQNALFCAQRVWNNASETGRFKRTEDAFQPLASQLASGTLSTLSATDAETVNEFFALCYYRAKFRRHPVKDRQLDVLAAHKNSKNARSSVVHSGNWFSANSRRARSDVRILYVQALFVLQQP